MGYKQDYYAKKAKEEHYVARSVYKLQEIQKKFAVFTNKPGQKTLDLGSAPGSWTQYMLQKFPLTTLVSIDLNNLDEKVLKQCTKNRATFIKGDFTDSKTIEQLEKLGPYNCIISDAAPHTTGNRTVDTAASEHLVEIAFFVVQKTLAEHGCFVCKIFEGAGIHNVLQTMQKHFTKVSRYTPKAVKQKSFEQYIICRDAKLFNNI